MPKKSSKTKIIQIQNEDNENEKDIDNKILSKKVLIHQKLHNEIYINNFLKLNGLITLSY